MDKIENTGDIIIYQTEDGLTKINVKLDNETVWLNQQQMAELYQSSRTNVVEHIKHIYEEGELSEDSTCRKFRQVRLEGNREVSRELPYYNLDMIISLGYRIKSAIATRFRIWATQRLKEYMIKGFTMDDERLKGNGGGNYWKELLDRIRDIRSSEKVLYRQVLDLYATSVDYNPKSEDSIMFFKMVQNKPTAKTPPAISRRQWSASSPKAGSRVPMCSRSSDIWRNEVAVYARSATKPPNYPDLPMKNDLLSVRSTNRSSPRF